MADSPPVRELRRPPPDSPAFRYPDELGEGRVWLDWLRVHHLGLAKRFLTADEGRLYPIDFVMAAVVSRSYSLVEGFITAFDTWNPVVAAPILRMEIDTLVRLAYIARVPKADEVALYVLKGGEFRHLKDAGGSKLTDRRLLEHAEEAHPWVADVYEATSGWVHFSPAHVRASWKANEDGDRRSIAGWVPIQPEHVPLSALQELLGAMTQATEEVFGYVEYWEARKGLPPWQIRDLRTGQVVDVGPRDPDDPEGPTARDSSFRGSQPQRSSET